MPRKKIAQRRLLQVDPKYNSNEAAKFIVRMMYKGKKSTARKILYDSMESIQEKVKKDPIEVFLKALENVKPTVEVKSRRVGGSTYQVPVEVRGSRRDALAMRWIIQFARQRSGKSMREKTATLLYGSWLQGGEFPTGRNLG